MQNRRNRRNVITINPPTATVRLTTDQQDEKSYTNTAMGNAPIVINTRIFRNSWNINNHSKSTQRLNHLATRGIVMAVHHLQPLTLNASVPNSDEQ
jgi:hypothetical protein